MMPALGLALWVTVTAGSQGSLAVSITGWLATFTLYLVSVWAFHQNKFIISKRLIVIFGLGLRLLAFPFAPALSDDPYRYHWEGWAQAQGMNPYVTAPGKGAGRVPVPEATAGYGPVVELLEHANYRVAAALSADAGTQVFWMKLHAVVFELATLALLYPLPAAQLATYAWCPFPIVEFWWNGHNDAVAVFFVVAALGLAEKSRWTAAFAVLGLATGSKWWPALLLPAFLARRRHPRAISAFAAALVVPALPYVTREFAPIVENARLMSGFLGGWRNNDSVFGAILWLAGGDVYTAKYVAAGAIVLAAVAAARLPLYRAALAAITALLLLSANCHPWYLTWFVPLLAFVPSTPHWLWLGLMPICYIALPGWWFLQSWRGSRPERWLVYAPVFLLAVATRLGGVYCGNSGTARGTPGIIEPAQRTAKKCPN